MPALLGNAGLKNNLEEEIAQFLLEIPHIPARFSVANLARHVEADPEAAIRRANAKFERRFRFVEDALAAKGMAPGATALAEMETLWNMAKQSEKQVTP